MKKIILPAIAFLFLTFGLSSCGEVCTECTYTLNGVPIPQETCGAKDEVEAFEADVKVAAADAGAQSGETPVVVCTRK